MAETPKSQDLHTRILELNAKAEMKHLEFLRAQERERAIWDLEVGELFALAPETISHVQAEKIFLEKYADKYDAALKEAHRLFDEYLALARQSSDLQQQELVELERELLEARRHI